MFTGTIANVATVLLGAAIGALAGPRLPQRLQQTILAALGLVTAVLAVHETFAVGSLIVVLIAILVGGVVGELVRIEQALERLGTWLQDRTTGGSEHDNRFARGFVLSSLVFCVGPLTVLGGIADGLGDPELYLIKAGLDGFAAVAFAAVYGWGVALTAVSVLVIQGSIAAVAGTLDGLLTEPMIAAIGATGGVLLLGVALRLLDVKQIRVANLLPALVVAPLLVAAGLDVT